MKKLKNIFIFILLILLLQPKGGTWAYLLGIRWLYIFILGFLFTYILIPLTLKLTFFPHLYDTPDEERKIHKKPIPKTGGICIFLSFILTVTRNLQFSKELIAVLIGATIVFIISLIDDIKKLPASLRIAFHFIATLILVWGGIRITFIPKGWPFENLLEIIITFIWIIGITNAINFLDGIDGLASSYVITSSLFFFLISLITNQRYLIFLTSALIGSVAGFLPYNLYKAKVFLGDSGAIFIGFLIGALAVMGSWAENDPLVALSIPVLILGVAIFDMIYITIARIHSGKIKTIKDWLEYTGRDHFHHRLLDFGFTQIEAVSFILTINIILGLSALILKMNNQPKNATLLVVQAFVIFITIVILMLIGRRKRWEKPSC